MKRHLGKSMIVPILIAVLAIAAVYAFLFSPASVTALNRTETKTQVKVFVGSSRAVSPARAFLYKPARNDSLKKLADKKPEGIYSAVLVFDDYYSAQAVEDFAEKESLKIERIYLWTPGETGRASLFVENGSVKDAITRFYDRAKSLEGTEEFGAAEENCIRMIEEESYGIFSVTVEASAAALDAVSHDGNVAFVDVKYSEKAEKTAAEKGIGIQYIELPYKPDGAL